MEEECDYSLDCRCHECNGYRAHGDAIERMLLEQGVEPMDLDEEDPEEQYERLREHAGDASDPIPVPDGDGEWDDDPLQDTVFVPEREPTFAERQAFQQERDLRNRREAAANLGFFIRNNNVPSWEEIDRVSQERAQVQQRRFDREEGPGQRFEREE